MSVLKLFRSLVGIFHVRPAPRKNPFLSCHVRPSVAAVSLVSVDVAGATLLSVATIGDDTVIVLSERLFADHFSRHANRAVRGEAGADAPAEPVRLRDFRRRAADDRARRSRTSSSFCATSLLTTRVDELVRLARADARVFLARRQFDGAADRERDRLLVRFREEIDLEADERVADVVAAPSLLDERIRGDRRRRRRRSLVKIGRRSRSMRVSSLNEPKSFDAAHHADGERRGEVGDVGEALDVVRAFAIAARRPFAAGEDFGGRHVPEAGVAGCCGGRGP